MTEPVFRVAIARWPAERDDLSAIRETVFIDEQGVPPELEWDGLDDSAVHFIARDDTGHPIGSARLMSNGQIGRMAVLAPWRGRGVGRQLLRLGLEVARTKGLRTVFLNAQTSARDFYEQEGFTAVGDIFEEAEIPHVRMELSL